jgi:hypothetical protein
LARVVRVTGFASALLFGWVYIGAAWTDPGR